MSTQAAPIGGPLMTGGTRVLAGLFGLGAIAIAWRLLAGLGSATALNDGYPFGLWIAFDVVTGAALACGGYAVGLLVYILNQGKYHPLMRPAMVTSALGYTLAGVGVGLDVGRWWSLWRVPLFFWRWNFNSALLEVALCIMAYIAVLWLRLAPTLLEPYTSGPDSPLQRFAVKFSAVIDTLSIPMIALGLVLATMHQSSLGTLMLLAGARLHPLWRTPLLPLLFLVTASMGLVFGNGVGLAMGSITQGAGTASAVLGSLQFGLAALVSPLVGLGGEFTALPMAIVMTCCAFLSAVSLVGAVRRRRVPLVPRGHR